MGTKLSDTIGISVQDVNKTIGNEYAIVTRVNTNQTVNLKPVNDDKESDELINIPVFVNLDLTKGDKVLLTYLDNNPNYPLVIGMKNPKFLSGDGGGSSITPSQILEAILSLDGPNSGLDADKLDGQELSYITGLINEKLNSSTYTASDVLNKLITVHGAGSGLDADKLDGYHYNEIISLINAKLDSSVYNADDILSKLLTVDGSGSGLDADKLDGNEASVFLQSSSYTASDILSKLLTVDGSGCGLDADKLDGYHIGFGSVTVANVTANTSATVDVTITAQPATQRIICFTGGSNLGTIQLQSSSGSTYTIRYKFESTGTNRPIYYIYFY